MKKNIVAIITGFENITIELDDTSSPKTCKSVLDSLPFSVNAHLWGEEIYTDESPIVQPEENAKELVELNDVAYWPNGRALCLFFWSYAYWRKRRDKTIFTCKYYRQNNKS